MRVVLFLCSMLFVLLLFGCGGKKSNDTAPASPSFQPVPAYTPVTRSHGTVTTVTVPGQQQQPPKEGTQAHVFKYSGKEFCGHAVTDYNEGISLNEMKLQLTKLSINVHNSYKSEDGKSYSNEDCGQPSGDINVYVINRSDLQKVESSAGFCECIPNQQQGACVIYNYATPPGSGCR